MIEDSLRIILIYKLWNLDYFISFVKVSFLEKQT